MPGLTYECTSGSHAACDDRECRCSCHPRNASLYQRPEQPNVRVMQQKMCPRCQRKAPMTESFCREDGTQLVVGVACKRCNAPMGQNDKFCWQCGVTAKYEAPAQVQSSPRPEATIEVHGSGA